MDDMVPLDVLDWAGAVNAAILVTYHANDNEDAPNAILGSILLSHLASDDSILDHAPEELRVLIQRWWHSPPPDSETPTLDDTMPAMRQLYEDWCRVYEGWRRKEKDRRKLA